MNINSTTYDAIIRAIAPGIQPVVEGDARAIIQLAELAVGIDLKEDSEERATLDTLARHVCANGGIDRSSVPPVSPLPEGPEERRTWLRRLARGIDSPVARALAYALTYVVIVSNGEIGPAESVLLEDLREMLAIGTDRAAELVENVSEAITPGMTELRAQLTN
ncbi:MAG: hypothetical protein AB7O24_23340 [Kofleriaceae bacterium]